MPLIVIEGPEKAGKSTVIDTIVRVIKTELNPHRGDVVVRHFSGAPKPDHTLYGMQLSADMDLIRGGRYVIWDRAWLGETVYPQLIAGREGVSWWDAEWLYGRAADTCGVKTVLLGPSLDKLEENRDDTDLAVSPAKERQLFLEHGLKGNWLVVANHHDEGWRVDFARSLIALAAQRTNTDLLPPAVAGPLNSRTIIIGDQPNPKGKGWLPFTSRLTTLLARRIRTLGGDPLGAVWANSSSFPPQYLDMFKTVITCGNRAHKWATLYGNVLQGVRYVNIPHPSWLYRYSNEKTDHARVRADQQLMTLIQERRL